MEKTTSTSATFMTFENQSRANVFNDPTLPGWEELLTGTDRNEPEPEPAAEDNG